MAERGLVSVVIVNFRTERYLRDCLASVHAQTYPRIETILVNNGSRDFVTLDLAAFRIARVIQNETNLGFARANNQGILASRGEFVLLLNADAYIHPSFVQKAVEVFSEDSEAFGLVPQVRRWLKPGYLESTGHVLRRDFTAAHRDHEKRMENASAEAGLVFGGTAACIIYRREALEKLRIGDDFFDADFFAYLEDVDLDVRANLIGLKYRYEPRLVAYHVSAGSGARLDIPLLATAEKNRYLMMVKCLNFMDLLPNLGELLLYEGYHILKALGHPYLFAGLYHFLRCLPSAIRKRRVIQKKRVLSSSELRKLLVPRFRRPQIGEDRIVQPAKDASANQIRASVIVVNYNGYEDTKKCLTGLREQTLTGFEVILVDNGSKLFEAEKLAREFPEAKVIPAPRNLGFAGGVNVGARFAKGKYVVLLNNDAVPVPTFLEELVKGMEQSQASAGCGVLVEDEVSPTNDSLNILGYNVKEIFGDKAVTFYPSGGASILRVDVLEKIAEDIFEELYFLYHEDVNLGWRVRLAGGEVHKFPKARAFHKGSATVKNLPRWFIRYHQLRNRLLNIFTLYESKTIWKLLPLLFADFLYWHIRGLVSFETLLATLRTDWFLIAGVPYIVRKRREINWLRWKRPLEITAGGKVTDDGITRWFSHKLIQREGFVNDLCKFYLGIVGIPTAD